MKKKRFNIILTIIVLGIFIIALYSWKSYRGRVIKSHAYPLCLDCNVILISIDALRAKSLPCFGKNSNISPVLCDFASKSYVFQYAYSQSTSTLDSQVSLLTSLYPISHGVSAMKNHVLSKDSTTLTQILKSKGYQTYYRGIYSADNRDSYMSNGLGRGFDTLKNSDNPLAWTEFLKTVNLRSNKFFIFFHTNSLTPPYVPTPETIQKLFFKEIPDYDKWFALCQTRFDEIASMHKDLFPPRNRDPSYNYCHDIAQYYLRSSSNGSKTSQYSNEAVYRQLWDSYNNIVSDGKHLSESAELLKVLYESSINELDSEMNNFFDFLNTDEILRNTIVVITGNRGQELLEHGQYESGTNLYEEVIHVPLILRIPNIPSQTINKTVQLIDVMPTILSLLSLDIPHQVQGINIVSEKRNFRAFSEAGLGVKRAIIHPRLNGGINWKLIVDFGSSNPTKSRELFYLLTDPDEKQNVDSDYVAEADALQLNSMMYPGVPTAW